MSGFAVDTPFTDLDHEEELAFYDHNDNISIDLNALDFGSRTNPFLRAIHWLSAFVTARRRRDFHLEDIELFDNDADLGNEYRTKKKSIWGIPGGTIVNGSLVVIIGLLIAIIVILAGKNNQQTTPLPIIEKNILTNGTNEWYPTTILISLDGFHPHYISEENTPFLSKLWQRAYSAPYMIPSNPTVTFTNHWTLVTGLKPIYHGIVGNKFFDSKLGETFDRANKDMLDAKWWGGDPIWSTAEKQHVKAATHMWPGSEVKLPFGATFVDPFDIDESLNNKVLKISQWLDLNLQERPQLMLAYVPTIDTIGHKYGVSGNELKQALLDVDNLVSNIYSALDQRNISSLANVVIVSDHGMSPTSDDRLILLDDLVDLDVIDHMDNWPLYGLRPKLAIDVDAIYESIDMAWQKHPLKNMFNVYRREDIQQEIFGGFNDIYNERIAPIWIIPKIGYSITTAAAMAKEISYTPKGVHGYSNSEVLMRALFLATGPYFEEKLGSSHYLKPFDNTEIYNIVCDSIDVEPCPNNGTIPSYVQEGSVLEDDWLDEYAYPNVQFEISILKEDSLLESKFSAKVAQQEQEEVVATDAEQILNPTPAAQGGTEMLLKTTQTTLTPVPITPHPQKLWDKLHNVVTAAEEFVDEAIDEIEDFFHSHS